MLTMKGKFTLGESKVIPLSFPLKNSGNKVQNGKSELVKETITGCEITRSKTAGQSYNRFAHIAAISPGITTRLQINKHI